ncbi:MAG: deoxyguanosinetriphosphate triphosphohydrolase, partial [Oscillospiraceae bacterium]
TMEGRLVKLSDKIAYINHDIDDAIRGGIFEESQIPKSMTSVLGDKKSARISTLVLSTIQNSADDIKMSDEVQQAFDELHSYMYANVYRNPVCKGEEGKAINILQRMYIYFKDNPEHMPEEYRIICENEGPERASCDYIAGMSDRYALSVFHELFVPESWA